MLKTIIKGESKQCPEIVMVQVLLATEHAEYQCSKPAAAYKKTFSHLAEQAQIAFQVLCRLTVIEQAFTAA